MRLLILSDGAGVWGRFTHIRRTNGLTTILIRAHPFRAMLNAQLWYDRAVDRGLTAASGAGYLRAPTAAIYRAISASATLGCGQSGSCTSLDRAENQVLQEFAQAARRPTAARYLDDD